MMDDRSPIENQLQSVQARLLQLQQAAVDPAQNSPAQDLQLTKATAELALCLEELQAAAQTLRQQTAELLPACREVGETPLVETASNSSLAAPKRLRDRVWLALDLTGMGWWDWDLVTDEVVWSENMFELLGLIPGVEPLTYSLWRSSVHPDDLPRLDQAAAWHLQTQTLYSEEYRVVHPDGTTHWLLSKGRGVYDATGQAVRMVGITLDITERKQLELALQTQEEQLHLTLDLNQIGSWDWQPNGTTFWNDYNYRLFGYQLGEVEPSYDRWIERIHPKDVDQVEQQLSGSLANQTDFAAEYRILLPDGQIRWLLDKGRGIYGPTGQLLRMIGVGYDITDRKQLEAERQQAAELDAFRVRLSDALRSLKDSAEIQAAASRLLGEYLRVNRVLYFEVHGNHYVIEHDYVNGVSRLAGSYAIESFGEDLLTAYQAGHSFAVADLSADPNLSPELQAAYAAVQIAAYIAVPILRDSEFVAGLAVHSAIPRSWSPDEIALVTEVAERTWIEIDYARAIVTLRQREAFISSILTSITDTVLVLDSEWRYSFVNDQFLQVTGLQLSEVIGQKTWDLFPDQVGNELYHLLHRAMAERIPVEFRFFYYDAVQRWFNIQVYPAPDGSLILYSRDITELKHREANTAFLAELMVDFSTLSTAAEIMQAASTKIGTYLNLSRCLFVEINAVADTATVFYDWATQGLSSLVGTYRLADFHSESERQQLAAGLALVIPNVTAIPLGARAAEGFRLLQIQALVNAPYLTQERWKFSLCAMQAEPRDWRSDEVELMQELSARIWLRLEQANVEAALQASEERLRLALDLTGLNSWDWDLNTDTVTGSDNMLQLLGLPPDSKALSYSAWQNSVHPEDRERLKAAVAMHLQNQTVYSEEYRVVHPDGTTHWLLSKARGVYDATGQAVRMVGITLDITERKQLELALQASEAKLRRILDSAIAVIVSFRVWANRDWEYEYWSAGCEALYGFSIAEMRADKTLWLSQVLPEDREALLWPLFDNFFAEENITVEYRFRCKDGSIRWICSVYTSEQIAPDSWMVTSVNYDVTERKYLEQEMLQINAALEQRVKARTLELEQALLAAEAANRAKSAFLATVSHELRTPLNAILGFSELLGRDQSLNPDQQEQAEIINRSGEHLLDLINDILQMAKLEAGQTTLTLNAVNLRQLLQQIEQRFRQPAAAKGLQFTVHCAASVPQMIQADESKLRQILASLLSNAVKFTRTGQISLRVQIQAEQQSSSPSPPLTLHFSVQDTGPGIDPLEQDLLFQPFVRTKAGQASQEGTGLGLPISREFVRLMGGELTFISSPGEGTTFCFQIPLAAVVADASAQPSIAQPLITQPSIAQPLIAQPEAAQPESQLEQSPALLLTALQTMPQTWIEQLQQASRMLDEELILQLLEQIPPTELLLLNTLKTWVNQFRFDQLIDLTVAAGPNAEKTAGENE